MGLMGSLRSPPVNVSRSAPAELCRMELKSFEADSVRRHAEQAKAKQVADVKIIMRLRIEIIALIRIT